MHDSMRAVPATQIGRHDGYRPALSCDTMVVLAPHTRGGATVIAKNSDRPPEECQPLFQAARARHQPGATVRCQYMEIPQVAETCALVGSRPWWLWGLEHGVNEHGVAIGNEAVLTRETLPRVGLLGMDLVRLGLERGRSAREAVEVIGALIEGYGQGGGALFEMDFRYAGGFIVADPVEAWVLESSARQWAARRVERHACISNRLTLERHDIASPGLLDHARREGWWDGAGPFDFVAAYSQDAQWDPLSARGRLARSRELLARRGYRTVREMAAILRDHYEMGELPVITAPPGSEKSFSLCMHNIQGTTASMIAELPAPDAGGGGPMMWACMAAPCTGIYLPLFVRGRIPHALTVGGQERSENSPWWRMKTIQELVAADPERLAPIVWRRFRPLESEMFERARDFAGAPGEHGSPGESPSDSLTRFMARCATRTLGAAAELEAELRRAQREN